MLPDMGMSLLRAAFSVGFSRMAGASLDRTILMLRAIPFLAVLPLVIVWLGIGEGAKIFLVAFGVTFPIYMNTVLGSTTGRPQAGGTRPRHWPVELATHPPHRPAPLVAVNPRTASAMHSPLPGWHRCR